MSDSKETVHARMPHRNRLTTLGVGGQATSRSPFSLGDDNPPRPKPLPKHTDLPLDVSDLRQMPTCIIASRASHLHRPGRRPCRWTDLRDRTPSIGPVGARQGSH